MVGRTFRRLWFSEITTIIFIGESTQQNMRKETIYWGIKNDSRQIYMPTAFKSDNIRYAICNIANISTRNAVRCSKAHGSAIFYRAMKCRIQLIFMHHSVLKTIKSRWSLQQSCLWSDPQIRCDIYTHLVAEFLVLWEKWACELPPFQLSFVILILLSGSFHRRTISHCTAVDTGTQFLYGLKEILDNNPI